MKHQQDLQQVEAAAPTSGAVLSISQLRKLLRQLEPLLEQAKRLAIQDLLQLQYLKSQYQKLLLKAIAKKRSHRLVRLSDDFDNQAALKAEQDALNQQKALQHIWETIYQVLRLQQQQLIKDLSKLTQHAFNYKDLQKFITKLRLFFDANLSTAATFSLNPQTPLWQHPAFAHARYLQRIRHWCQQATPDELAQLEAIVARTMELTHLTQQLNQLNPYNPYRLFQPRPTAARHRPEDELATNRSVAGPTARAQ